MRPASRVEIVDWDAHVIANPDGGHVLQTRAWGEFKRAFGWKPEYRFAEVGEREVAVLALRRHVAGLGDLWYVPKGPGVSDPGDVPRALAGSSSLQKAFAVKVEPEIEAVRVDATQWARAGLRKSPRDVQMSRSTIIVDIRGDEDALLASFKPKCRYNIRLAARRGVEVTAVPMTEQNMATMYSLMGSTQDRAGFFLRPERYFRGYWSLQAASGQAQLFFATLDGTVLAGVVATYLGRRGWYKDGGSTRAHASLMAPHLLQWEVMRWLRGRGVESYDLVAVPPSTQLRAGHPLYGLYRFKSGFSEAVTDFTGTWDLPLRPRALAVWERWGERVAERVSRRLRRDLFY